MSAKSRKRARDASAEGHKAQEEEFDKGAGANRSASAATEAAESDREAETASNGDKKSGYETMVVGVSKANKPTKDALDALAAKLECKPSALVWAAIASLLAKPPTVAPAGAAQNTGSAAGFWTVPVKNGTGRVAEFQVKEVASRGDSEGRAFFRYKKGDKKERDRARNQAVRAAKYDMDMLQLKGEPTIVNLPEEKAAK